MAMEPPHPHAWRVADRSLSMDEKRAIVDAYAQIHARGVLHGDVTLRHMLIGRDGKPTIINFRRASCVQPAIKIGLGGCSTHEFQLEMRQVKFLLDYKGAREFEYQLARGCRSAAGIATCEGTALVTPLPVPEITLREWDASTLEDLPPPSLPFYISGTPDISMHPISWISSDRPLCADNFYTDSRENNAQSPPPTAPSLSRLKGKQREHDGNADVVGSVPTLKHNRFCPMSSPTRTEEVLPVTCHLIFDSEQEHRMAGASLTSWNYSELTTKAANLEPGMSAAPVRAVIPSNNCMMHWPLDYPSPAGVIPRDQLSSPLPLSHDIEYSSPSWSLVSLTERHHTRQP
ncbi:hypothetical protein BJV77DRAFT_19811 [Russula vinacea]|nr:hypothetical protein BJV77DRAFT_19811 [Russula vinacea]